MTETTTQLRKDWHNLEAKLSKGEICKHCWGPLEEHTFYDRATDEGYTELVCKNPDCPGKEIL